MNLPTGNNNPGDLREAGQPNSSPGSGGFAAFPTPQDGMTALENQIQTNMKNKPQESLEDFASHYAPASDGNNVGEYTAKLASQLGVSPLTPISSLSSKVGQFSAAVANNEGYHLNQAETQNKPISHIGSGLETALGVGAGLLSTGASALANSNVLPDIGAGVGATAGTLLDPLIGPAGTIGGSLLGTAVGEGGKTLLGDITKQGQPAPSSEPITDTTTPSPLAQELLNSLGSTVSGTGVTQEAEKRGIDLGNEWTNSGLIPQPDANGNYNKIAPTLVANAQIGQYANQQEQILGMMNTQTPVNQAEQKAMQEIEEGSMNTGETEQRKHFAKRYFSDIARNQPVIDRHGTRAPLSAPQIQEMQKRLSIHEKDFARPSWERGAATHIKSSLVKRLDEIAEKEGIKGWKETKRKMETLFLIKKAIKSLPKKAQRDKRKELLRDVASSLGGAAIGRTLGHNSLLGALAGHLLQNKLGTNHYKSFGSKKEQEEALKRSHNHIPTLLHT